jgi:hypothetical protein
LLQKVALSQLTVGGPGEVANGSRAALHHWQRRWLIDEYNQSDGKSVVDGGTSPLSGQLEQNFGIAGLGESVPLECLVDNRFNKKAE